MKFSISSILVLEHKKRNDHKITHPKAKLIVSESDIQEAFKSMHQSIMTKIKSHASEDWVVLDVIIKHIIKINERWYKH